MHREVAYRLPVLIFALTAAAATAQAPDPVEMAGKYAESAQQNAMALRQYSWKMRTEVTVKGEAKPARLNQMRFDLDGKLQKTPITAAAPQKKTRGLRGRIKKKKIAAIKEWAAEVNELVMRYAAPSPGTMFDFYAKATFTPSADGSVEISGNDFLEPGDRVTFWIDPQTSAAKAYSFSTSLDGDAVKGQVEYGAVPGGPQYAARTTISVPSKDVRAKVETFDYIKQ